MTLNKVLMADPERGGIGAILSKTFTSLGEEHFRQTSLCKEPKERAYLVCSKNS